MSFDVETGGRDPLIRFLNVHFAGRTVLLLVSETVLVVFALLAAVLAWFTFSEDVSGGYTNVIYKLLVPCVLCILSMHYYDLYDSGVLSSTRESMPRLAQALGTVCVVTTLLYYAYPVIQVERGAFVLWIVSCAGILVAWRHLFCALVRSHHLSERTLLVGNGPLAEALPREIETRPELGIDLLGYVQPDDSEQCVTALPSLGRVEQLSSLVESRHVSRIIITMGERRGKLPVDLLLNLKARGVEVLDGADTYEAVTGKLHLPSLRPSWLLFSNGFRLSKRILIYKRVASIAFAIAGLLLSSPVMVLICLAVWLDSQGPVFFRQERVGRGGKNFTIYKFRTMFDQCDARGDWRPAQKRDKRFTPVGRVLRRTRLDELPQLYNILRGDMYLIGPRPFTPNLEREFNEQIPFYSYRWNVKPGVTGWAQTQRGYCSSLEDNADKLSWDLYYIKNMSVGLDCVILFQTVKIVLLGRGSR